MAGKGKAAPRKGGGAVSGTKTGNVIETLERGRFRKTVRIVLCSRRTSLITFFLTVLGSEIAKEISRVRPAAGLDEDVVDLLEKKSLLLAERVHHLSARMRKPRRDRAAWRTASTNDLGDVEDDGLLCRSGTACWL